MTRAQAVLVAALTAGALAPLLRAQGTDTTRARDTTHAPPGRDTSSAVTPAPAPAATTDAARAAQAGQAQAGDTGASSSPADTAVQRVRTLIAQGQTTAARALVDSLLTSTPATSRSYPSILYTRATLATNADSAETDYRRVIVEYAASPQAADALLRLAQLELARGDRQQAAAHLDRLTREQAPNQTGTAFARTELQVGLAYFDLQDTARACASLAAAGAAASSTDVELKNRIDYNVNRCKSAGGVASGGSADSARKGAAASARGADSAKALAAHGGAPPTKGASHPPAPAASAAGASATTRRVRTPGYTVQVAAYQTQSAAQALVGNLRARGFVARIYGTSAPFRVRVGRFALESQADSAARSLKRKGITGFVTPSESTE